MSQNGDYSLRAAPALADPALPYITRTAAAGNMSGHIYLVITTVIAGR